MKNEFSAICTFQTEVFCFPGEVEDITSKEKQSSWRKEDRCPQRSVHWQDPIAVVEWEWDQHRLDCVCEMGDTDISQAEAFIYKNSVTDFYSKLNLCQNMTQLLMLGLYYLARFFTVFPRKSLFFLIPSALSTRQVESRWVWVLTLLPSDSP